jgi:hypothetical protein
VTHSSSDCDGLNAINCTNNFKIHYRPNQLRLTSCAPRARLDAGVRATATKRASEVPLLLGLGGTYMSITKFF